MIYMSEDEFSKLPPIVFELKGKVRWKILPEDYFENRQRGYWNNRIYLDETSGATFGSNAMRNHDFYFDLDKRSLGIAKADCDKQLW